MPPRKNSLAKKPAKVAETASNPVKLLGDLRTIIETGRSAVAQAVNAGLVLLYWSVGDRIRREILGEKRAKYGEEIIRTLSGQLTEDYGSGFSKAQLLRMIQFAERFPENPIVAALSRQLGWSHFMEIIPLEDDLKRDFYAEMCRLERWSVRTLRDKIRSLMYERTAISKQPEKVLGRSGCPSRRGYHASSRGDRPLAFLTMRWLPASQGALLLKNERFSHSICSI